MSSGKKQYDDFLSMNVNNVKVYFTVRGISVSEYNEVKLVAQAYSVTEMDLPIILSSVDLTKILKEEYSKHLREFNIFDPKNIEKESWLDDLTVWSKVNLEKIFEYILKMKKFVKDHSQKIKGGFVTFWPNHIQRKIKEWLCGLQTEFKIRKNFRW